MPQYFCSASLGSSFDNLEILQLSASSVDCKRSKTRASELISCREVQCLELSCKCMCHLVRHQCSLHYCPPVVYLWVSYGHRNTSQHRREVEQQIRVTVPEMKRGRQASSSVLVRRRKNRLMPGGSRVGQYETPCGELTQCDLYAVAMATTVSERY
jgi:hypothetical protein